MNVEQNIKHALSTAFKVVFNVALDAEEISLQPTKQEFEGTYTFTTFSFSKLTKASPDETARLLGNYLTANTEVISGYNVVKGFLNLTVADQAWIAEFRSYITSEDYSVFPSRQEKVIVEYSSPNTNKPLHLGHLRNNFLGYSVSQILSAYGYEVVKVNLVNDRGIHICKSMVAYTQYGNGETPDSTQLKGDHLAGKYYVKFDKVFKEEIAQLVDSGMSEQEAKQNAPIIKQAQNMLLDWEAGNMEVHQLWSTMNNWVYQGFEKTYHNIGVSFDKFYYESNTYLLGKELVQEGLDKQVFYKKDDGSVWVDLRKEGLDEKLLLRADGTSVYITQDLGTAELKYQDFQALKSIYVVGNEQDYHFKVLQLVLKKLGKTYSEGIYHLSYGMVDLPTGKMKSREGTVVDADDLIAEMVTTAEAQTRELGKIEEFTSEQAQALYHTLGMGALKYFLLKVDPKKRMLFNPQESVEFQGNTGPFIQYTFARISAILRKGSQLNLMNTIPVYDQLARLERAEQEVIYHLSLFPSVIKEAAENYAPSILCQYLYDLAKHYNRFYSEVPIFQAEDQNLLCFRLHFSSATAKVIEKGMKLLGINVPERM